jgi:ATP/maltotriose-dependent transcriptional regulator MalT
MEGHLGEALAVSNLGATRSREWMHRVITLLEAALGQLHNPLHPAQGVLLEAASLLRQLDSHFAGPVVVADLCGSGLGEQLTRREISILKRLESGLSNKEIAEAIFVSEGTLKWHLHNVYSKLRVKNRSGAMARARTLGIV